MIETVLGGTGFIGQQLAAALRNPYVPLRGDPRIFNRPLGTVYYCIGLTSDFRTKPYDTIDAHVTLLRELLAHANFDQFILLSSTRVYAGCERAVEEEPLVTSPFVPDHLYNISKIMGESLALSCGRPCKVVRLSNVVGPTMGSANFIGSITTELMTKGSVNFLSGMSSTKDYIWCEDVVSGLQSIARATQGGIYNLAAGQNVTNRELAHLLTDLGVHVGVEPDAVGVEFPTISIEKLIHHTGFRPQPVLPRLREWWKAELQCSLAIRQGDITNKGVDA